MMSVIRMLTPRGTPIVPTNCLRLVRSVGLRSTQNAPLARRLRPCSRVAESRLVLSGVQVYTPILARRSAIGSVVEVDERLCVDLAQKLQVWRGLFHAAIGVR